MRSMRAFRLVLAVAMAVFVLTAAPAYSSHNGVTISSLVIDPLTPTTLYAGTPGGMFKSIDAGASWSASRLVNTISALAIDPLTPSIVYSGVYGGIFKSTDGGVTWNRTGDMPGGVLVFDPLNPNILYAGAVGTYNDTPGDLYTSTDGGTSWSAAGLFSPYMAAFCYPCGGVSSLKIAPLMIFGVTEAFTSYYLNGDLAFDVPPGVIQSMDGGRSWGGSFPGWVNALATDPLTPTTRYAATSTGLYKSTDGGASWNAIGLIGAFILAIDPLTPTTLYAGTTDGVYKSTDGGASWNAIGLTSVGAVLTLAIDPLTPTTLYAGTGTSGVYKSSNGGVTWDPTGLIAWSHISSVTLNPPTVVGGNPSTGTVTLNAPAPADGTLVELGTWPTNVAAVPASVMVAGGATSADFVVSTSPIDASRNVLVSGATGGDSSSAVLTVTATPATLSSLSLNPTTVAGGVALIGTVTLSTAAPAGGAVVALSSSNPTVATVPAGVTVAAGAMSADFTVSTNPVTNSTTVAISATYGGSGRSTALTVTPITTLSLLRLSPVSVTARNSSRGTVTLSAAAPTGGAVVTLASSDTAVAIVPASVTVAAGATSATFTVSTSSLNGCAPSVANISATYGDVTRSAGLTVIPAMDTVTIQQADYFANKRQLRVGAKSTSPTVTLQVYVTSTGALIGTLHNLGDGRYTGQFTWPANPQNITVRSSLCGSATKTATAK